jgi:hypothetical protein
MTADEGYWYLVTADNSADSQVRKVYDGIDGADAMGALSHAIAGRAEHVMLEAMLLIQPVPAPERAGLAETERQQA